MKRMKSENPAQKLKKLKIIAIYIWKNSKK